MRQRRGSLLLQVVLMSLTLLWPPTGLSQPDEISKEKKKPDPLTDELEELEEDDFPDLVSSTETGGIMDELLFLEESGTVVLPARHKQKAGLSPSAITVLTREDIETSGAQSIPDLLRMSPGMDVVLVSPFYTGIATRLFWTYEDLYFLVLIDGREANLELLGQPIWPLQPIFLSDIERIEIIRGPGSSLYGANAVAGVVSITTRAVQEKPSVWVEALGGEAGTLSVGTRASMTAGSWGFSASGGIQLAGMLADPRDLGKQVYKFRLVAEHRFSETESLKLDAGFSNAQGPVSASGGTIDSLFTMAPIRLAYESGTIKGQIYWVPVDTTGDFQAPLTYAGLTLATFPRMQVDSQLFDAEIQWTPPEIRDWLLLISGARARVTWLGSDNLLDADSFAVQGTAGHHKPGIDHTEARLGGYVHAELAPADWITITAGSRLDYNTVTGMFASPRLAGVFSLTHNQFLRISAARAFRKPAIFETHLHPDVTFPEGSPFQTLAQQNSFREFMTRVFGNSSLENEELTALELGYRGEFLDRRLAVSLELYFNHYANETILQGVIMEDSLGLPDLDRSHYMFSNQGPRRDFLGAEVSIRYSPSRNLSLVASWAHREAFLHDSLESQDDSPKNLITVGGRYRSDLGLLGSLYIHTRSEFREWFVANPEGILAPFLEQHMDNVALVIGRLGYRWESRGAEWEAGCNLFLPLSPFSAPHFRYYEEGGGETIWGERYGGDHLARRLTFYLQGTFSGP